MKMDKSKIKNKVKSVSDKAGKVLGARQTKYGSNTFIVILALLGILVLVNYIVNKESGTLRWDMTKNKQYTLSDQTRQVLKTVKDDVKITAFYRRNTQDQVKNLLDEYQAKNSHLKVEFIDPDVSPSKAREYGITKYGTIVFQKGNKKQETTGYTESDITSSILKLNKDKKKTVYFIIGHNEKDINKSDEKGYSTVKDALKKEGYEVKTTNLITEKDIPSDASVVVLAGPQKPVLDKEKEALNKYLDNNGKLLVLIDPSKETKVDVKMTDFLEKKGVVVKDGMVIDTVKAFFGDVAAPVIDKWETHQITEKLSSAFFPGVLLIDKKDKTSEDVLETSLGKTSNESWLETDLSTDKVKFDKDKDQKGPISIAVALHQTKKVKEGDKEKNVEGMRIVVIGDSDFAINNFASVLGNQDLILNSINWLAQDEELISIRPKDEDKRSVALTGTQAKMVFYTTVIIMPLVVIVIGVGIAMRRRKRSRK